MQRKAVGRDEGPRCHALPLDEVFALLASRDEGLSDAEAGERQEKYGPNELPEAKRLTLFGAFLRQFRDPLIYILLVATAVSLALAHVNDAIFIGLVLLLNAVIGTVQEQKAEESARALQRMVRISARVLRDGAERRIDAVALVPGDVVLLASGDAVPADLRLFRSEDLQIDESLLTGESMPVSKEAETALDEATPLGDRRNMAFAGSLVSEGRGRGVVCATGASTEVGRIAASLAAGEGEEPPLLIRMRRMSRVISIAVLVAVAVLAAVSVARGAALTEIFFVSVALAVSAIPEGLPVAITVALAVASRRMASRRVIVRLLPAVEGLGACTLIASDKTGTLTANELTVRKVVLPDQKEIDVEGSGGSLDGALRSEGRETGEDERRGVERLAKSAALCNEARLRSEGGEVSGEGDAVDVAFLVLAARLGLRRDELLRDSPQVAAIPYEPKRRMAASFHESTEGVVAHVKGAVDVVLPLCRDVEEKRVRAQEVALARNGYRVIALASGNVARPVPDAAPESHLRDLELLGLAGLIDPVRPGVPEAVERCRNAGVDVRMITGDHPATGIAIARRLGIAEREEDAMTGAELRQLEEDREALDPAVLRARVFARVEPRQKTVIVNALQRAGHFVAVTGDGVNDAPALRGAHIGVAMGASGTDVARSAADLILTDDNFASIVNGIEEGRVAYDNVRKVTWLLVATGFAEIVLLFLAIATGLPLPLTAVQLLWLNLVTNGIQDVALAFEKGEEGVLKRKPRRPAEGIFDRRMVEEVMVSGLWMGAVGFAVFAYLLSAGVATADARMQLLLLMVVFENAHVFNCRSETRSAFRVPLRNNVLLVVAVVLAHLLHVAAGYIPWLEGVLGIAPIPLQLWLQLVPIALTVIVVSEVYKWLRRPREEMRES